MLNRKEFYNTIRILSRNGLRRIACAYIDGDLLKETNFRFGRSFGDMTIDRLENHLLSKYKTDGRLLFKIGGDEYIILFRSISDYNEFKTWDLKNSNKKFSGVFDKDFFNRQNYTIACGFISLNSMETVEYSISCLDKSVNIFKQCKYSDYSEVTCRKSNSSKNYIDSKTLLCVELDEISPKIWNKLPSHQYLRRSTNTKDVPNKVCYQTSFKTNHYLFNAVKNGLSVQDRNWLYFDLDNVKTLGTLFGREECVVPTITIAFHIIKHIADSLPNTACFRVGGDEGLIKFDSNHDLDEFLRIYNNYLIPELQDIYLSGKLNGKNIYDKEKGSSVSIRVNASKLDLLKKYIPVGITFVTNNDILTNDIRELLNYFEAKSNNIKLTKYSNADYCIQSESSRVIF